MAPVFYWTVLLAPPWREGLVSTMSFLPVFMWTFLCLQRAWASLGNIIWIAYFFLLKFTILYLWEHLNLRDVLLYFKVYSLVDESRGDKDSVVFICLLMCGLQVEIWEVYKDLYLSTTQHMGNVACHFKLYCLIMWKPLLAMFIYIFS